MPDKLQSVRVPPRKGLIARWFARESKPEGFTSHHYPHIWQREPTTAGERLLIAPRDRHVQLLLALASALAEPFGILYVLLVPRLGHEPGRYQAPRPLTRAEVIEFFEAFEAYFEQDGRHHVWLTSLPDKATLVYDHHNVIYAYGPLDTYERILRENGLASGDIRFPDPHGHCFNPELDHAEEAVMTHWDWIQSPLREQDGH